MSGQLKDFILAIQSLNIFEYCLLFMSAISSILFTEIVLKKRHFKNACKKVIVRSFWCILIYGLLLIGVSFFIYTVFSFVPHGESFCDLLIEILRFYGISFMIPFIVSILFDFFLNKVKKDGRTEHILCAVFLIMVAVLSSFQFFLNSFRLMKRPYIQVPIEAVSSLVNSHMNKYPFALSSDILTKIGNGYDLLITDDSDNEKIIVDLSCYNLYPEPKNFNDYISAVLENYYPQGITAENYLRKAYDLFLAGRYTNDDIENIAHMWRLMYTHNIYLPELKLPKYLDKALEYYQKSEEVFEGNSARYSGMAEVYNYLGNYTNARYFFRLALELNADADEHLIKTYKECIRNMADMEPSELLMEDVQTILHYNPQDLSMIILYAACALNEQTNIEDAYRFLCEADNFFQGKSAMVKILRCICANQMGNDESFLLKDIYALEEESGLNEAEEAYLIRYLFITNRSEELWGYIVDTKDNNDEILGVERMFMKAEWYFKIANTEAFVPEEVENFLAQIQERLAYLKDETKEKELLQLAEILLQSSLGEMEPMEPIEEYTPKGIFYVEYALAAITAFNAGKYEEAISYCGEFFVAEERKEMPVVNLTEYSLSESPQEKIEHYSMQPQEEVNLHCYVQLIYAYSYFEYAKEFPKDSEERASYIKVAEQECDNFKQSSKSFYYIGELFQTLKNSIDIENGKVPEEEDAGVEIS